MVAEIRCIVIEDQLPAQRVLETYVSRLEQLTLTGVYGSATEAADVLEPEAVDLLFLDIHLPKLDGFSFLRSIPKPPDVVVTTAYSEHALEGFELNVTDYLLKPFSFERFCQAVAKVEAAKQTSGKPALSQTEQPFFIKVNGDFIRLNLNELVHISSDGNFLHINMKNTRYHILGTLQSWLEKLPHEKFKQVQKSHIVNMDHVEKISGNQISTCLGPVPIGRAYKSTLLRTVIGPQ